MLEPVASVDVGLTNWRHELWFRVWSGWMLRGSEDVHFVARLFFLVSCYIAKTISFLRVLSALFALVHDWVFPVHSDGYSCASSRCVTATVKMNLIGSPRSSAMSLSSNHVACEVAFRHHGHDSWIQSDIL